MTGHPELVEGYRNVCANNDVVMYNCDIAGLTPGTGSLMDVSRQHVFYGLHLKKHLI
jgi:hypothetical protein